MKLYDLLRKNSTWTIWDKEFDTEWYMEDWSEEAKTDSYYAFMMELSKKLDVSDIDPSGLTVDAYGFIEKHLEDDEFKELWNDSDIEPIMDDWSSVMAGYASMSWYKKAAEYLMERSD